MRRGRSVGIGGAIVAAVLLWPAVAWAHPLGNFTVNTFGGIQVRPGRVEVGYVVDMAEIPTQQELPSVDANGDQRMSSAELAAWARSTAPALVRHVSLSVGGRAVPLRVECTDATATPGQGGLPVLRLEAGFAGAVPAAGTIEYSDRNYADRVGWREVTASAADGAEITGSTVPAVSVSNELQRYPSDLLSSPLRVRDARVEYASGSSANQSSGACLGGTSAAARPGTEGGGFADLVGRRGSAAALAIALVLAFGFGAVHALGPGHGKTLMAAYLVGAGARVRQAVAVGGAVSVMHTASVLVLGVLVLSLERTFTPDRVYPWLGVGSGLVALGLGAALLVTRMGAWAGAGHELSEAHEHEDSEAHGHELSEAHEHGANGDPDHAHGVGLFRHSHADRAPDQPVLSRKGLMALAVAGGILPSPTALVVLLSAVSFHRVVFGFGLIGAFSIGIATALVVVGILALRARDTVSNRLSTGVGRLLPVLSAGAIAALGCFLTVRGVIQL
jgi:nickel/cobalt transporter (NicO) family protein